MTDSGWAQQGDSSELGWGLFHFWQLVAGWLVWRGLSWDSWVTGTTPRLLIQQASPGRLSQATAEEREQTQNTSAPSYVCACVTFPHTLLAKARPVDEKETQADLRGSGGSVPDHCNKANITIK